MFLVVVLVTLGFLVAADPANGQDRQRLLSTEEWVNLHEDTRLVVAKTVPGRFMLLPDALAFTAVPPEKINDEVGTGFLQVQVDEGFRFVHARIVLKPGRGS